MGKVEHEQCDGGPGLGLAVRVFGPFHVLNGEGEDVTPRPMKAKALLALLIASPGAERSRDWIKSKLWSDRSDEQASVSLRRTLSDIRKAFGDRRDVLIADKSQVALDMALVSVDDTRPAEGAAVETEPFEGIDVRDAEFEDVIRDIRAHYEQTSASAPKPQPVRAQVFGGVKNCVIVELVAPPQSSAEVAGRVFCDNVTGYLNQLGPFEILRSDGTLVEPDADQTAASVHVARLRVHAVANRSEVYLGCEVGRGVNGPAMWSDHATVPGILGTLLQDIALAKITRDAVARLSDAFAEEPVQGSRERYAFYYANKAKHLMFNLDRDSLLAADQLLIKANEQVASGAFLAWRAFLRLTARNQYFGQGVFEGSETSDALLTDAVRLSPNHPTVQAICSQIELFNHGDQYFSLALAQMAYDANSADPLNCAMLSNALLRTGRKDDSYEVACRALEVSRRSRHHYYFQHFACMSAAANGNYESALAHASVGLGLRPEFTSLRRYQVALSVQHGNPELTQKAVGMLQRQEPGFSVTKLVADDYPAPTMKVLPLGDAVARYAG